MMMALGDYRFSLDTSAFQSSERSTGYRWGKHDRMGRDPLLQFVGPGDDTLRLAGVIFPHYKGGLGQLEKMRVEAAQGEPLSLVQGDGAVLGRWVIESVSETRQAFFDDGTPRQIEFSLELRRAERARAVS